MTSNKSNAVFELPAGGWTGSTPTVFSTLNTLSNYALGVSYAYVLYARIYITILVAL